MVNVEAFSTLAITFFLTQGDSITGHPMAQQTSYISATKDAAWIHAELVFLAYPLLMNSWWLIIGVDVITTTPLNAVVAFGSSTTDGVGLSPSTNRLWPDYFAHRPREAGGTQCMSVINAGLSGNQLTGSELLQIANSGAPSFLMGEAGQQRLAWDVEAQPGATDLIIHIGSNDLRAGVEAVALIEALQQVVQHARKTYQQVFGTTILSGGCTIKQAEQRRLVNNWMLEHGNQWFDAVSILPPPCMPTLTIRC